MFNPGTIVKVLIPNVINTGYDYRLPASADIGQFVRVSVMNKPYIGVIIGFGDSGLSPQKIKDIAEIYPSKLSIDDLTWIKKMSNWTLMTPGAVLRLIINVPDAFLPPKMEPMYNFNFSATGKMTENRQMVMDAYASNDNTPMTINDLRNISHVSSSVINTMIKRGLLTLTDTALRAL